MRDLESWTNPAMRVLFELDIELWELWGAWGYFLELRATIG